MAQAVPNPPSGRKRVKVYELRNNDWFDRGTGFAIASSTWDHADGEPRIIVEAEEGPERLLLETQISRQGGFAKQQETLIIWTEPVNGVDMALSFQESDGCTAIWKFIHTVQQQMVVNGGPEDALSEDMAPESAPVNLPVPDINNLKEVEMEMRQLNNTQAGRDALAKFIIHDEYIPKLVPLIEEAEAAHRLGELHRLCNIMKMLILLNDNDIIEYAMTDEVFLGVMGALEYDPDFPSHKANHRQWLGDESRYKEVVRIDDDQVRRKIHHTYRLQYLKDVALARVLDDPTFSILNSLIFYYQVDIIQHIQGNPAFLNDLFAIFGPEEKDEKRKKDAVLFIQQCCAIAKNFQPPARNSLYNNFLNHGLLAVINYALAHSDVAVRVGATDVLVSVIDHDPQMIRQTIFRQISEKQRPLTDSLIDLLLVEVDLGVKAQIADAIKVLLDPGSQQGPQEGMGKIGMEFGGRGRAQVDPQQEGFLVKFYEESAKKLFSPLVELKDKENLSFNVQQVSLFEHLIEILWFFIRQHQHRSKYFVLAESLGQRIAQLLSCPEKHLKLTALKFFRNLLGLNDEFYNQQMIQENLLEPILNTLLDTMPRNNLLNSACLDFFEYIRNHGVPIMVSHLVERYRDKIQDIQYVDTFTALISRFDHASQGYASNMDASFLDTEDEGPGGVRDLDPTEEQYFNTSDDEDDIAGAKSPPGASVNGASPVSKPLVDYTSDEETDMTDAELAGILPSREAGSPPAPEKEAERKSASPPPPERVSEKRRREEDEEDEITKLASQQSKRRNSSSSVVSVGSNGSTPMLRRKKSFNSSRDGGGGGAGGGGRRSRLVSRRRLRAAGMAGREPMMEVETTNEMGSGKTR
ncbi:Platinum sensitivity protein [Pseudogymnoascus australis]